MICKNLSCRLRLLLLMLMLISSNSLVTAQLPPLKMKLVKIAGGFTSPVGVASPDDQTGRLFILEQGGKIKIIKNGVILDQPFLNVSGKLDGLNIAYSEKGLLGVTFHPDYKNNGRFYIYYSAPMNHKDFDHQGVVSAFNVSKNNPDLADTAETIILRIPQPESNHNGGCLQFGKDGFLYIGLGDGGGGGDRHGDKGNGQDLGTLLGKILRIDVSQLPYSIPPDNPFVNIPGTRPEIFAYGLRNPWRFSFDRVTGKLFCADVGQNQFEEVNIIEKGKNYGWRIMEGYHCYDPPTGCNTSGLALPIHEYDHNTGISICGGYMYRGLRNPSLHGTYLFGDWSGKLFYLKQNKDQEWSHGEIFVNGSGNNDMGAKINSMGEDMNGDVYVITQHLFGPKSPTGSVFRLQF